MTSEIEIDKVEVALFIIVISLFIIFSLIMLGIQVPAFILLAFGISAMIVGILKLKSSLIG
jgi:hypothetical protein